MPNPSRPGPSAKSPSLGQVSVQRHPVNWEAEDLDEATGSRIAALGEIRLRQGCYYFNPRYTVYSTEPSPAFFETVRAIRSSWLRTTRLVLSNYGQRRHARKLSRQHGPIGRHFFFSGVMFLYGDLVDAKSWHKMAEDLLPKDPTQPPGRVAPLRRPPLNATGHPSVPPVSTNP
jgi:hypothetical protein